MDMDKLTNKTREALASAHAIAVEHGLQELRPWHLLAALAKAEEGVVPALLQQLKVPVAALREAVDRELGKLPSVSGPGAQQVYSSRDFSTAWPPRRSMPNG